MRSTEAAFWLCLLGFITFVAVSLPVVSADEAIVVQVSAESTCADAFCGNSTCACSTLETAFDTAAVLAEEFNSTVRIEVSSGYYRPAASLSFTSRCFQLVAVDGEGTTTIMVPDKLSLFRFSACQGVGPAYASGFFVSSPDSGAGPYIFEGHEPLLGIVPQGGAVHLDNLNVNGAQVAGVVKVVGSGTTLSVTNCNFSSLRVHYLPIIAAGIDTYVNVTGCAFSSILEGFSTNETGLISSHGQLQLRDVSMFAVQLDMLVWASGNLWLEELDVTACNCTTDCFQLYWATTEATDVTMSVVIATQSIFFVRGGHLTVTASRVTNSRGVSLFSHTGYGDGDLTLEFVEISDCTGGELIRVTSTNLYLRSCIFSANLKDNGVVGESVLSYVSTDNYVGMVLNVTDCKFIGNASPSGMLIDIKLANPKLASFANCTLLNNSMMRSLLEVAGNANFAPFTMTDCTVSGIGQEGMKIGVSATMERVSFDSSSGPALNIEGDFYGSELSFTGGILPDSSILVCTGYKTNVTIEDSVLDNNFSYMGGGALTLSNVQSDVLLRRCNFTQNYCGNTGGSIISSTSSSSSITLEDCLISGSSASKLGGSIAILDDTALVLRNTVVSDSSAFGGGCVYVAGGSALRMSGGSVIERCIGSIGGGVYVDTHSSRFFHVAESTIRNCTASIDGGAVAIGGGNHLIFEDCLIYGNAANNVSIAGSITTSLFRNCTIHSNSAASSGGAVYAGDSATLELEDCRLADNYADSGGGGILVEDFAIVNMTGTVVSGNCSPNGAGIQVNDDATLNLDGAVVELNTASASGGGISMGIRSTGSVCNSIIRGNYAHSKGGGVALYYTTNPSFINTSISSNTAVSGAGVWLTDTATPTFVETDFCYNGAISQAGAILVSDYSRTSFVDCSFRNNTAGDGSGGGMMVEDFSQVSIDNCTFLGNSATNGGAVFATCSDGPVIRSSNFSYNHVTVDGGAIVLAQNNSGTIENCSCTYNLAEGNGGCIKVSDLASPLITDISIQHNSATIDGGGIALFDQSSAIISGVSMPMSLGSNCAAFGGAISIEGSASPILTSMDIRDNFATTAGGGIFVSSSSAQFVDAQISGNHAPNGGGFAVSNTEALYTTLCSGCSIDNNYASHGGGLFLEVDANRNTGDSFNSTTFTFVDTIVTRNNASMGGAVYYDGENSMATFGQGCRFTSNIAGRYGGGVYFSVSSRTLTPWIYNGIFEDNGAGYAGYNSAWVNVPVLPDLFCFNCTFGPSDPQSPGYATFDGHASDPKEMHFVEGCPSTAMLTNQTFSISLLLLDGFSTPVTGPVVNDHQLSVTASSENCDIHGTSTLVPVDTATGKISFSDLFFVGKNGTSCRLTLLLQSSASAGIPPLQCTTLLMGCPEDQELEEYADYDGCVVKESVWSLNVTGLLLTLVGILGCLLLIIIITAATMYGIYLKRRQREYDLAHTEIPDLSRAKSTTLEEILSDPKIPRINWSEMEMGKRLGVGASGVVSSAVWNRRLEDGTVEQVDCAVKELLYADELMFNSVAMDEFILEIKLMSALVHRNIVTLLGICVTDNTLYLITELMHKGNLRDVLDSKGANLPWSMRQKLAKDAAKGIAYLHERNVIHRDLKPQNLLVNDQWECKVADFGVSTIKTCTRTMTCIGTPMYMAPEVLTKNKSSEKSDVYSFGIILVELYTGYRPYTKQFAHLNQAALMWEIIQNGARPDVSELPPGLHQLVMDTWNEDPELRPSFNEIIVRLRRLGDLELPAQPAAMQEVNAMSSGLEVDVGSLMLSNDFVVVDENSTQQDLDFSEMEQAVPMSEMGTIN